MRYILHTKGQVVNTCEFPANEYSVQTPGCETVPVLTVSDETWQHVVDNPTLYRYEDGELILNDKGDNIHEPVVAKS